METKDKVGLGLIIFGAIMLLLIASGWVMNIIDLVQLESIVFCGEHIMRIIGIFIAPIGAFMGWFF